MRPAALLVYFLSAALAAGAAHPTKGADDPEPDALKGLAGEWSLASTSDEHRDYPGNQLSRMAVARGGRVRFLLDGDETNSGTFVPAKAGGKLKGIDLKLKGDKVLPGVYSLDGGDLILCFAEEGKARPISLEPKGTQWAERWQRTVKSR